MSVVLDASAVLAYLRDEPGADAVAAVLDAWVVDDSATPLVSAVNWTEVAQRVTSAETLTELATVVEVVPFDVDAANLAATLFSKTRKLGLSLADRACLALALQQGAPVLTADRDWARVKLDVDIRQIR